MARPGYVGGGSEPLTQETGRYLTDAGMHDYDFKKLADVHAGPISLALLVSSYLYRRFARCVPPSTVPAVKPGNGSGLLATCEAAPADIACRASKPSASTRDDEFARG